MRKERLLSVFYVFLRFLKFIFLFAFFIFLYIVQSLFHTRGVSIDSLFFSIVPDTHFS